MDVNKKKIVFAAASVCHSILVDAEGMTEESMLTHVQDAMGSSCTI